MRWQDKWRRRSWKVEYWTRARQFVLKRDGKEGKLLWNPKVKTVNKVEHNQPDRILQGPTALIEFSVCRDDSVVGEIQGGQVPTERSDTNSSFLSWS
jgi:hypothetical protein